jgi:hypothetical protein
MTDRDRAVSSGPENNALQLTLGGRDTEERMHRFVTFHRGRRPRTAAGPGERPELRS